MQNQEDCTFTLLALLPTLSAQIMDEMDVEDLTHQLQQLSSRQKPQGSSLEDSVASLATSEATSAASSSEGKDGPPAPATSSSELAQSVTTPVSSSTSADDTDQDTDGQKTSELGNPTTTTDVGASWSSEFQQMDQATHQPRTNEQVRHPAVPSSQVSASVETD